MILLFFSLFFMSFSYGDLDPAAPLLRGRGSSPTIDSLDSGRFIIKPTGRSPRSQQGSATPPAAIQKPDEQFEKVPPTEAPQPQKVEEIQEAPAEQVVTAPAAPADTDNAEQNQPQENDSNLLENLRALILGVNEKELLELKTKKEKTSEGENTLEVYLSPSIFYYDSSSAYSIRNFSSSSPGYTVGLSLWLSPYFGVEGEMQSSLGASMTSLSNASVHSLNLAKNRIGLTFRRIDLKNTMSPQTLWRISYSEFSASTSRDNLLRVSTKSNGLQIAFEAKLPSSSSYSHRLSVNIEPRLSHKEKSGLQQIKSGNKNISSSISASIGGEISFNRKSQVYWTLHHRYERNLFKGMANAPDPKTGLAQDGLGVDQSLTLFSIGYRWGK